MISITAVLSIIAMFMMGMLTSFYLGSRKEHEKIFESEKNLVPEEMDIPQDVTEEDYQKALKTHDWTISGERKDTESDTG